MIYLEKETLLIDQRIHLIYSKPALLLNKIILIYFQNLKCLHINLYEKASYDFELTTTFSYLYNIAAFSLKTCISRRSSLFHTTNQKIAKYLLI